MLKRQVASSFARWEEYVEETIDLRDKMKRVVARMANRAVAAAFATWRENAEALAAFTAVRGGLNLGSRFKVRVRVRV